MAIDTGLVGSVINALPLDRMIGGPLHAMITAQVQASRAYAEFLMTVCIKDGKAVNVEFEYDETQVDTEGNFKGTIRKTMRVPLLAAITHPNICVEEGSIDFELEVTQSEESHSETSGEGGFEAKMGWGPFSVKVHGKVSHKSEQTRKTDTRAKYSIHTAVKRQGPPEALMRVIDFLTDAATKPVVIGDGSPTSADALPADTKANIAPPPENNNNQPSGG
ncbi:DUF2589 domain-containing protein [Pseudoalteromonas ruthenica]|uniref:DUF2589 domain-containing protein n=1 Tax=Pseudoalteromonas ruthenica TaxID=151081 RepID=UPI00241CCD67|nr:DUF2589 domain-containing protein [Pseudoalteromonas ruthenica]|tara:strand:- start:14107 stop:14766 length:660 start_codon:yes stop_codon:yes gene_type:complete